MRDQFAYVRDTYGMPWLRRGIEVLAIGKPGNVTSATHYVFVRLVGEKHPRPYHPSDVVPLHLPYKFRVSEEPKA